MNKLLLLCLCLFSTTLQAETYALIIGINNYEKSHFSNLKGAVNDADLIYDTLKTIGVPRNNLVKLTDAEASKANIQNAWSKLIGRSTPADTLIFSFAGHGTQEQDLDGDEMRIDPSDKLDETLVLSGYASTPRKATGERIVDDEMYTLFRRAKGRQIIFIADFCHSGGATRSIDPRAKHTAWQARFAPPIEVKVIKQNIRDSQRPTAEAPMENLFFFAATASRKQSLEGLIEGKAHGALSWAFSQVLRDSMIERKGELSFSYMKSYIDSEVKKITNNRQFTDIQPRDGSSAVLFSLPNKHIAKPKKSLNNVRLSIIGKPPAWIKTIKELHLSSTNPDLIWDTKKGEVLNKQGDITAYNIHNKNQLEQVLSRVKLISVIDQLAKGHFIHSQLSATGDKDKNKHAKLHHFGSKVAFSISHLEHQHIFQFNIAGNGKVECYPKSLNLNGEIDINFAAQAPAGNDSLITLALNKPSVQLSNLITNKRCENAEFISKQLPNILKKHTYQLGRVDIFTGN